MKEKSKVTAQRETEVRIAFLQMQREKLIVRYEKMKRRNAFVKRNIKLILSLSMDGWPRTRNMKDFRKWLDLIYKAKVSGIYSVGTANCDVISKLHRLAKELNAVKK
jgi:RNase adaptor protein for sRNA GlmZ degradation